MKVKRKEVVKVLPMVLVPPTRKPRASKAGNFILDGKFWDMERDGATQSIIALFALCPQKAHWKMVEGLSLPGKDMALDFGSFFHEALDKVYSQKTNILPADIDFVLQELHSYTKKKLIDEMTDPKDMQEFEVNYGICQVLLRRYFQKWKLEDKRAKWVDVERVFEFPYQLRDGTVIKIKGKFDGVFTDSKGNLWLFETKTKSNISNNHIMDKMAFDLQVMIYLKAMSHVYKTKPVGVLYNLVKRPYQQYKGTYYKKPETLPQFLKRVDTDITEHESDYFQRYHVTVTQEESEIFFLQDFDYIIERLYQWQQGGISNFRNSAACSMWNRPCEYLQICSNGDKSGYTQRSKVFPELQQGETE